MMGWAGLVSYGTMLSLALESLKLERQMNAKMIEMGEATARSVGLQASAAENEELAVAAQEQSAADEGEGTVLEKDGEVLIEKSNTDAALAIADQVGIEELEADVVVVEEESAAHAAAAALDEGAFDGEIVDATADAGEASRLESQARGEEVVIGFCEFVPFLDVACDVIGGVSAAGLELGAAAEAVKAATEYAAAVAAKADEDEEIAFVADLQGKVVEDGASAAKLQTDEAELAELAEEERAEGEADEVLAEEKRAKAEVEEETAAEEEEQAAAEEEQSEAAAQEAIMHGVGACWDSLLSASIGIIAFGYFAMRVLCRLIIPGTVQTCKLFQGLASTEGAPPRLHSLLPDVSYVFHHCAIFFLSLTSLRSLMSGMNNYDIRARGGVILLFALLASTLQAVVLHSVPKGRTLSRIIFELLQRTMALTLLFIIELLILWVYLGAAVFTPIPVVGPISMLGMSAIFAVTITAHLWFFELPTTSTTNTANHVVPDEESQSKAGEKEPAETDVLLLKNLSSATAERPACSYNQFSFMQEISKLLIPIEILAASCMFMLLKHCILSIRTLWPVAKPLLLSSRPDWLVPAGAIGVAVFALIMACIVVKSCRRHYQRSNCN